VPRLVFRTLTDSFDALAYERNVIAANRRDAGINVGAVYQTDCHARHAKIDGDQTTEALRHIDPICGLCVNPLKPSILPTSRISKGAGAVSSPRLPIFLQARMGGK